MVIGHVLAPFVPVYYRRFEAPDEINTSPRRGPLIRQTVGVHARSALFDLYGDHLLDRGAWAPIAATVGLMGSLDISAAAVRTAVSRMVREGWLKPEERGSRGYAATPACEHRLRSAHARIYRTRTRPWDGHWHVMALPRLLDRTARSRVARSLGYLGYGRLAADTWVAFRESPELGEALAAAHAGSGTAGDAVWAAGDGVGRAVRRAGNPHQDGQQSGPGLDTGVIAFDARFRGPAWSLAEQVWDTRGLATAYRRFTAWAGADGLPTEPEQAFVARTLLVHEWRKFLFTDPGLPEEVLPADWPGRAAAALFDERQARLKPLASAWVEEALARGLGARSWKPDPGRVRS
jgi:phenylacetic acid degradation operon negative regulatory protein